jgi:uncharacterized membrane protein YgcG
MDGERYLRRIGAGVKTYLQPEEIVERVVSAQTYNQFLQMAPIAVMVVAFVVGNYVIHANKSIVVIVLVAMFFSFLALNSKNKFRYVVVTNQRVLLVDGGYFGTDPGAQLLRKFSRDKGTNIPSTRYKSFNTLGERLYVRYSIQASTPQT